MFDAGGLIEIVHRNDDFRFDLGFHHPQQRRGNTTHCSVPRQRGKLGFAQSKGKKVTVKRTHRLVRHRG